MAALNVHDTILDTIVTGIEGIGLTSIDNSDILKLALPFGVGRFLRKLPGISVCPVGVEEIPPEGGTNLSDEIAYPSTVFIVDAADGDLFTNVTLWMGWREQIIDTFIEDRLGLVLAGVREHKTIVTPGPIIDAPAWIEKNYMVSVATFKTIVWKERRRP